MNVSLVIPLRDEEATVHRLLESIAAQSRPPDEVIVVDAGSEDDTARIVRGFALPCPLQLVSEGPLHPGLARNAGVARASGEWIAFTDGGIRLDPGWLAALVAAADGADVVFGNCDPIANTRFTRAASVAYVSARDARGLRGPFVPSMMIRRPVFDAVGGFPGFRAAEDLVFFERLVAAGARPTRAPEALVKWEIAPGPARTFRRFASYSFHNLVARRGRHWHRGVLRLYAGLLLLVGASLWAGLGGYSLLLLPAFFLARALKAAWYKKRSFDFATLRPDVVVIAAFVLALVDLATLAGSIRFVFSRRGDAP